MRYDHGHKPRNPYNMIIQENHAAARAISIISQNGTFFRKESPNERNQFEIWNESEFHFKFC